MVLSLLKNAAVPLKGKLFACYVIHESLLQLLLCSISVMIQTPLIQSPTHTHPKLKTWHHHHTSSHNTRRCFCEFLSFVCVLDQFAYFSTKRKFCWIAEAFQLKSHETKGPYYIIRLCTWSSLWVWCPQCFKQMFGFLLSLISSPQTVSVCCSCSCSFRSLPSLNDSMAVTAAGIHAQVHILLKDKDVVGMVVIWQIHQLWWRTVLHIQSLCESASSAFTVMLPDILVKWGGCWIVRN